MEKFRLKKFHFYHAPWSRWFKTFFFAGSVGYEVQIGPKYWILRYKSEPRESGRRIKAHHDPYWR